MLPITKRASVCNGDASLCNKLYSNVTYIGTHDSYAIGTLSQASSGYNQEQTITQQLNDGVRLLQIQVHTTSNSSSTGSGLDLCHTSCSLVNGGSLESYLSTVKSWMDSNANEVVTLLMVNSDDQAVSKYATAFESTGISSYAYAPSSGAAVSKTSWPTLGSMIDAGKRLVVFIDNSADVSSVDYILPEFQNVWENPYNQDSLPFNCSIDRINTGSDSSQLMYLVNHYLDSSFDLFGTTVYIPNTAEIATTNGYDSILQDANNCAASHSSYPTYVLTDYYDQGNGSVFQAAAAMNGIEYTAKAIGNYSSTYTGKKSGSSTTSSSSSSAASNLAFASSAGMIALACLATAYLV
ncbi:PLC-like phosphodiesterase [Testicularia cyperi]|uniref:PLC-like phosphodiesterase n=1 Tax=Testicularia cyperi TaxID=1882483 RepID=A0A317XHR6_9BASI|nr:PLC-like phosphodiesterase [Testicularia cyperi]